MKWTAVLQDPKTPNEADRYTLFRNTATLATADGAKLGLALNFRWQVTMMGVMLLADLDTDDEAWIREIGNPEQGNAAYAGPFKVLRAWEPGE